MEIKTLEQYVLKELDAREEEIANLTTKFLELQRAFKELSEKHDTLMSALLARMQHTVYNENSQWYELTIYDHDDYFGLFDELFGELEVNKFNKNKHGNE